jgi:DnaJ-class molecular chaperone
MNSGSRAFRAASSQKLKREVVRLIFGPKYARQGPDGHRKLDPSIYSFADLKKAYLGRVQEIHPDKIEKESPEADALKRSFQELQDAWKKYEELAKLMTAPGNGDAEANFTMFGVGCSFSDTEEERILRDEFTEQACRGWLSSALLGESSERNRESQVPSWRIKQVSLLDEALFTDMTKVEDETKCEEENPVKQKGKRSRPKTLIPGIG